MECWHRERRLVIRLLDDSARPHRHASVTSWTEHGIPNAGFNPLILPVQCLCDFYAPKEATSKQEYTTIDLLQQAIDREIPYKKRYCCHIAIQKLREPCDMYMRNKGSTLLYNLF